MLKSTNIRDFIKLDDLKQSVYHRYSKKKQSLKGQRDHLVNAAGDEVSEDSDEALTPMIICDIVEEPEFNFDEEEK